MDIRIHPRLEAGLAFAEFLGEAAEAAAIEMRRALRTRRRGYLARRPGPESPLWNACAAVVRAEVRPRGAKAKLARYLGIPRQRLQDFLNAKCRLPDAEIALQMLHWVIQKRAGRDLSLLGDSDDVTY